MITYCLISEPNYDPNNIKANIVLIDKIITQLLNTALTAALNGDTVEYTLDTGQTKVNKVYTTPKQITDAILEYKKLRGLYASQLGSRVVRLVDIKIFGR